MQKHTFFAAATGSRVDRESGVLRGVSVITEGEAKGHGMIVDGITLDQVKSCAETYVDGLRVKMDHYTGIDAMVGVLRDFVIDGTQLRADLHLIKSHEDFEKIMEMAETIPGSFGLSISFSGESDRIPVSGVEGALIEAARCMEIYSADIVDQPAANPTGLFQAMPEEIKPEEVPAAPIVEDVAAEEVTEEVTEEKPVEEAEVPAIEPVPAEESLVSHEQFEEVKPDEEVIEVADEPVADLPDKELSSKLSEIVLNFENSKTEIISLRADLETAHRNLTALKSEIEKRDLAIADLEHTKRIALQAVGLLPSDVEIEVEPQSTPFNPVEAYAAAVEAGDKKLAAELFRAHKAAIFASRRN
jgi:hypothetical protein